MPGGRSASAFPGSSVVKGGIEGFSKPVRLSIWRLNLESRVLYSTDFEPLMTNFRKSKKMVSRLHILLGAVNKATRDSFRPGASKVFPNLFTPA